MLSDALQSFARAVKQRLPGATVAYTPSSFDVTFGRSRYHVLARNSLHTPSAILTVDGVQYFEEIPGDLKRAADAVTARLLMAGGAEPSSEARS